MIEVGELRREAGVFADARVRVLDVDSELIEQRRGAGMFADANVSVHDTKCLERSNENRKYERICVI